MGNEFASVIQDTDNYYVIVTREGIPSLPYSVDEIYGIRDSGKYGTLKQTYNEFYHIYHAEGYSRPIRPEKIITEDSNSGFQFFEGICSQRGQIACESAYGKSNLFASAVKQREQELLLVADGAAFGSEMEKLMRLMKDYPHISLYLPESFEWLILSAGLVEDSTIDEILEHPEDYIESQEYFSWEQYFTACLVQKTQGTYLQYAKKRLNPAYLQEKVAAKILLSMKGLDLK